MTRLDRLLCWGLGIHARYDGVGRCMICSAPEPASPQGASPTPEETKP